MSDKFEHFARKEETKILSDSISETTLNIDSRMRKVEERIDQSNELKDELFEDLSSVSDQNQKTSEEMAQVKETLAAKDEIIRHLTSQDRVEKLCFCEIVIIIEKHICQVNFSTLLIAIITQKQNTA